MGSGCCGGSFAKSEEKGKKSAKTGKKDMKASEEDCCCCHWFFFKYLDANSLLEESMQNWSLFVSKTAVILAKTKIPVLQFEKLRGEENERLFKNF